MTRKVKIIVGAVFALVVAIVIAAVVTVNTRWFHDYVRSRIISSVEDATGGRAEVKSFAFAWRTLTATVTGFVIRGTEPPGEEPLFEAPRIVLRLRLRPAFKRILDFRYLEVDQPKANVIAFKDGRTNLPVRHSTNTSSNQSLEKLVNLAIDKVNVRDGTIHFLEQQIPFSMQGEGFVLDLVYMSAKAEYDGNLSVSSLYLARANNQPIVATVAIPVQIRKDAVQISNAHIQSAESTIVASVALSNLANPELSAQLNAHVALQDVFRIVSLPSYSPGRPGPQLIDAFISGRIGAGAAYIENASVAIGKTHITGSGDLHSGADFRADISLDELGTIFKLKQHPTGLVTIAGTAKVPAQAPYLVTGNVTSNDISLNRGWSRLQGIHVSSSFRADPQAIEVNDFTVKALGGQIVSFARINHFKTFVLRSSLRNFAIRSVMAALSPARLSYAGLISGVIEANGVLALSGLDARAALSIAPGLSGTPVAGVLRGSYQGKAGVISVQPSYITLPNSRIDFSGNLGTRLRVEASSRNFDDFLPAVQVVSPATASIPVNLRDGGSSIFSIDARGSITDPHLSGRFRMMRFTAHGRNFDRLAADFQVSSAGAALQNGVLAGRGSQADFAASLGLTNWHVTPREPLSVAATVHNGDLAAIMTLAGYSDIPVSGVLDAGLNVSGTFGNPQGSGQVTISDGAAYGQSIEKLATSVELSDQRASLKFLRISAAGATIEMACDFIHPRDDFKTGRIEAHLTDSHIQLADLKSIQGKWPGAAGTIFARGDLVGQLRYTQKLHFTPSAIDGNIKASGIRDLRQNFGNFSLDASTYGGEVIARGNSDLAGSAIQFTSRTQLAPDYPSAVEASIRDLPIGSVLSAVMPNPPVAGTLSAKVSANGTFRDPHADLSFDLTHGNIYHEPIDRLTGAVDYTNKLVDISLLRAETPAGSMELHGSFSHAPDFQSGSLNLETSIPNLDLQKLRLLQSVQPDLGGSLRLTAAFAGEISRRAGKISVTPSNVAIHGEANQIAIGHNILGNLTINGETQGHTLSTNIDSSLGGSAIHGSAHVQLTSGFPTDGAINFTNVSYAGFRNFFPSRFSIPSDFNAAVEGGAAFKGSLTHPEDAQAELRISKAVISSQNLSVQNQSPLLIRLDRSILHVENIQLTGRSISVAVNGTLPLHKSGPMDVSITANTDLSVVKAFYKDAFADGNIAVQSGIRGTLAEPLVNGHITLKNASLQLTTWPNGIFNANGTIALNGSTAQIESLTAESGGGHVTLDGFVSLNGTTVNYDVRASTQKVRTRVSGASITADAAITLTGTSKQSILGGTVTIDRIGYSQQSDIGSILSSSSTLPHATRAAPGGIRLNLRVETAPDVRFQTNLAEELSGSAELNVYGSPTSPGIVGRVSMTGGTLIFFGNKYTVNRGLISFFDPTEIAPILDVDLQTTVQGVDVDLGAEGPIHNLKLTYRSDPPLKFEDIVALLATGKTPPDPTIAVNQPFNPHQNAAQMGESALLAQAVANPLASRLERVFGVSQIKIAPSFVSGSSLPQARVTIQQQVSGGITLTYSQDLAEANSELIRIEWAMTPRFSAVATRDENGIFGVDLFYKKQFH